MLAMFKKLRLLPSTPKGRILLVITGGILLGLPYVFAAMPGSEIPGSSLAAALLGIFLPLIPIGGLIFATGVFGGVQQKQLRLGLILLTALAIILIVIDAGAGF